MPNVDANRRTLGMFWVLFAVICIVKLAWLLINSVVLTLMWGALLNRVPDPFTWMSFYHFAMFGIYLLLGVTAVVSFFLALSLLSSGLNANRGLALVAGFLAILTGPLGIAVGVYTWIVFVPRSADQVRLSASS
jgi:hypothetical protein